MKLDREREADVRPTGRVERKQLFDTYNAGYVQELYETFVREPGSVAEPWRALFGAATRPETGLILLDHAIAPAQQPTTSAAALQAARAAGELVDAYRLHGHRAARLDPLGSEPAGHPTLEPEFHGTTEAALATIPAALLELGPWGSHMGDVLSWLKRRFCGHIGYEFEYLEDPARREWLRRQIEDGAHLEPLPPETRLALLHRLTAVEGLEQFLHRAYLGHKRFSIEGLDMLVPMLDLALESAASAGARGAIIGMAHRGRVNVLTHVVGRPYAALLGEFEGQQLGVGTGDVKYHLGAEGTFTSSSGSRLRVQLAHNPSHLEFVNPVVTGIARALQERERSGDPERDQAAILPILIHGDAAFIGQGVVAETLNLSRLDGYNVGGTVHIIANNQIGFTTDPRESRSTRYASDLARGFRIPVFHVNADDPEACLATMRLALAYRTTFREDVLIDLVGYRRYGHNEADEPAYTQPLMYRAIESHPRVRQQWADELVAEGLIDEAGVTAARDSVQERLREAQEEAQRMSPRSLGQVRPSEEEADGARAVAGVTADKLLELNRELHQWPADFAVHSKLAGQLARREQALEKGAIDWAHAEALALASLLADGTPVRLTGQDALRGTFSQRHAVLVDTENGSSYFPLANLSNARAPLAIHNSPLSEAAALGFEYGFALAAPETLVIWEAQFGDFANSAQVIIDQFLATGQAKWGKEIRLTLLLPHGYEGQGPEHSSARPERFLQLAAEDNMRVVNCTTPAQYFHLLRRQALHPAMRPLVVFSPKSLLRHPRAVATLDDLTQGGFQPVLDDPAVADRRGEIERIVLCTGKIYFELTDKHRRKTAEGTAVVRVESLYPFPEAELERMLAGYPAAREVIWGQEEPQNMGAWSFMEPRLRLLVGDGAELGYRGRPPRASTAEGYAVAHATTQDRILAEMLGNQALAAQPA